MIVLDTNVISEVFKSQPDARVVGWLESLTDDVAITAVTLAELLAGLRRLPDGRRKENLTSQVETAIGPYRDTGAIIAFDATAASRYADILTVRESAGLPIATGDAQIAAICRAQDAVCATRNTRTVVVTGATTTRLSSGATRSRVSTTTGRILSRSAHHTWPCPRLFTAQAFRRRSAASSMTSLGMSPSYGRSGPLGACHVNSGSSS